MKKVICIFMACIIMMGICTACGQDNSGSNHVSRNSGNNAENNNASGEKGQQTVSGNGKTIVVYYSASGNTDAVAKTVAKAAGADTFEILPEEIYTDDDLDWTDDESRVSREHDDPDKRDVALVSETVENWEDYETVLIGYPIWWGIAAWPVDNFIKTNDFTGKTVIPFCTSASSGMGESGELLAEMAGTGEWLEGQRFRERPDKDDVISWVQGLGL